MKSILLFTACLTLVSCRPGNQSQNKELPPPNILWISCEDISPALGCYGDSYARTPALDRLANDGVLYSRAYVPSPICSPARSTLITGVYATTLGTQHLRSEIPLPDDFKILPQFLSEAGYFCSNNDKTDYNFNPEGRWDDQGNEAHWRNREEGQPFFSVFNHGITHEGHANSLIEEDVKTLEVRHDPDLAELPPYFPDTPGMRKIWAHQYDLISILDRQVDDLIGQLKEDGLYDNTIIFFFSDHGFGLPRYKRWLYHTGLHVPLIIRVPDQYRHLIGSGPGSEVNQLVSFVDFAPSVLNLAGVDVPSHMVGNSFLGEHPQTESNYVFGARSRADDAYEVSRSVLDDQFIYIRNFMPHQPYILDAIIFSDRKAGFKELRRLRDAGQLNAEAEKLWLPKAYEELYDLKNDPHELNNLAGDPAYREKVETMRDTLYDWIVNIRDVGFLNESEMMNRSKGSSPYAVGSSTDYNLKVILDAANMCGNPDATLNDIVPLLEHSDAGVRYWGVISLHAWANFAGHEAADIPGTAPGELSETAPGEISEAVSGELSEAVSGELSETVSGELSETVGATLNNLLEDDSPAVSISAAELLCHMGMCEQALPILGRHLKDAENPTVVLQAAISLRNLGENANPLIPEIGLVFAGYRGEVWGRYKNWLYSMFIGFALDQVYLNCGMEIPG